MAPFMLEKQVERFMREAKNIGEPGGAGVTSHISYATRTKSMEEIKHQSL